MTPQEFDALKADIAVNGQHEAIWTWRGMVLDGRHRERACETQNSYQSIDVDAAAVPFDDFDRDPRTLRDRAERRHHKSGITQRHPDLFVAGSRA